MYQIKRAVLCVASYAVLIIIGSACSGSVTITAVKQVENDPAKIELKVDFKAKSWKVIGTVGAEGKITFEIEGKSYTINGLCPNSSVTIEYSDPLLVQVPTSWVYVSGSWSNAAGEGGAIIAEPISAFSPSQQGPFVAEPGRKLLALHSLTVADIDTTGSATLVFDVGGELTPTTVKAMDVILITSTDDDCVSPYRSLEPQDSALGVNFASLPSSNSTVISLDSPRKVPTLDSIALVGLVLLFVAVGIYWMSRRKRSLSA